MKLKYSYQMFILMSTRKHRLERMHIPNYHILSYNYFNENINRTC